jgi:hypothetical protein
MNWLKRRIRQWLELTPSYTYPHRFISFVTWHDKLIGVDGNGDLYELSMGYTDLPIIQLMTRNPLEKWHGRDDD